MGAAANLDAALDDGAGPSIEPPHVDTAGPSDPPKATKTDKPPRKRTANGSTPRGGRPSKAAASQAELERQLGESFAMVGFGLMAMGTSPALIADGTAIIERAPALAQSLAQLAAQNPAVHRLLSASLTGGAWFGVLAAFGGLGVTIAQNHGALPGLPGLPGDPAAPAVGLDLAAAAAMFGAGDVPPPTA